jgi:hypothetical protein
MTFGWSKTQPAQGHIAVKYNYSQLAAPTYLTMEVWELTAIDYASPTWHFSMAIKD